MSRTQLTLLILVSLVCAPALARAQTTWHVDDDCAPPGAGTVVDPFCTIQSGVDASSDGDIVLVGPGTYTGDGNRDISLFGNEITLRSSDGPAATIIDIQGSPSSIHRGFYLIHGEGRQTVIEGFTITNGYLKGDTGGSGINGGGGGAALYIREGSPTIRNCVARKNTSWTEHELFVFDGRGGAVLVDGHSDASFENCILVDNVAAGRGGGSAGPAHPDKWQREWPLDATGVPGVRQSGDVPGGLRDLPGVRLEPVRELGNGQTSSV